MAIWRGIGAIAALLVGVLGLAMAGLGGWLIAEGGSAYYLIAGLGLAVGGGLYLFGRRVAGLWVQGAAVIGTLAWSLWEIGGKGWMPAWGFDLAGRIGLIAGLVALCLFCWMMQRRGLRLPALGTAAGVVLAAVVTVAVAWERTPDPDGPGGAPVADTQWTAFGGDLRGERYSGLTQVNIDNVGRLSEAWRFSTGDMPPNDRVYFSAQNTPIKVGDNLYVCSATNTVFALDPATGAPRWRYDPEPSPETMESVFVVACRAIGHYVVPGADAATACRERVYVAVIDSRLISLDARTGRPCPGFGSGGTVDLSVGMGMGEIGFASNNSGPTVAGGLLLVGQQVSDNQTRDAPSGVVRAYDAVDGRLVWAWDPKRPDARAPLAPGEVYPRGTPNVWNVISADESLGLAYLGTGNAAADHYGGTREPEDDAFSSAVVAVDLATGATRWVYRTVERDRWDYDIGAQPIVTDLSIGGQSRRVVIQTTKTGSIFVLDAATGQPVRPVEMRPAPQGGRPGERLSPFQPQSVFYPNLSGAPGREPERLDARHAFGLTPLDAAWCRIEFHRMRYEGMFTPPSLGGLGMLLAPGTVGGPNWGGAGVDRGRGLLITNHSRLPNRVTLHPRDDVDDRPIGQGGARPDQTIAPHEGTPYGVDRPIWMSPLQVPCIAPPWGYLAATDLNTGRLVWSRPLGTGQDMGPLGIPSMMRIEMGTPNLGGAVVTAGGLTFIAAAQDDRFRAFETATGRLLWSARLPAGGQASAMTYAHGGRQYVAVGAYGHARFETKVGDTLMVYALPD